MFRTLTLNPLTWKIWRASNSASKWQMRFNSAFKGLIYPSSGACDCVVELPHRSSCSDFAVCWRLCAAGFGWCSFSRLNHNCCASACNTGTTQNQPHQISNTQRAENKTTDVVIQQHIGKLLLKDILMSETC